MEHKIIQYIHQVVEASVDYYPVIQFNSLAEYYEGTTVLLKNGYILFDDSNLIDNTPLIEIVGNSVFLVKCNEVSQNIIVNYTNL